MASLVASLATLVILGLGAPCECVMLEEQVINMVRLDSDDTGVTPPYISFSPRGLGWCSQECKRRDRCVSFNFIKTTLTCQLLDTGNTSAEATILSDVGTLLIDSSALPIGDVGPCEDVPCSAHHRCEEDDSGSTTCQPTECVEDPPSAASATVTSVTSRLIGQAVSYTCDEGNMEGDATVYCLTSGEWSAVNFTCHIFRTAVFGNNGILVSPGYPGYYGVNLDHTISVTLEQDGPQNVTVTGDYHLEPRSSGCYDYIIINNDGVQYCGTSSVNKTFLVTGASWSVRFYSDDVVPYDRGFLLTYSVN